MGAKDLKVGTETHSGVEVSSPAMSEDTELTVDHTQKTATTLMDSRGQAGDLKAQVEKSLDGGTPIFLASADTTSDGLLAKCDLNHNGKIDKKFKEKMCTNRYRLAEEKKSIAELKAENAKLDAEIAKLDAEIAEGKENIAEIAKEILKKVQ